MASATVDPDVAGLELQDGLPSGLDYTISNVGAYVEAKRENQISAISGDVFSPSGNRIVRFSLGSSTEFLVPESLCLSFDVRNNDATAGHTLKFGSYSPNVCFQRVRVLFGAAVVEDIEHYSRLSSALTLYHTQERRQADAAMGLGRVGADANNLHFDGSATIAPSGVKRVVCHPFPLGITRVQQLIPLAATAPLQLEFYLSAAQDAVIQVANGSNNWSILNVKLHYDTVLLSDSLTSRMLQHLKAGKPLKMLMSSWSCQSQSIPANQHSFDIQSQRSFNSVKSVMFNCWRQVQSGNPLANVQTWPKTHLFLGPLCANDAAGAPGPEDATRTETAANSAELQLQLGSWRWPTVPAKGVAELQMMLRKATGSLSGPLVGLFDSQRWPTTDTTIMFDLEKMARHGENLTGIRSNAGSIMTVQVKNWGPDANARPTEAWICLRVDQIVTFFGDSVDVAV
jgi:hypothetical protein